MLNARQTVLESVLDAPTRCREQTARTVLGSFLFRGDDVFKTVGVLSGGEKSRLALVKLLLDPPNLLLMDEPTTHLDVGSIDALIGALKQYEGTLIFISHDVHFIRAIATSVLHINAGQLTPYAGDYQYYLDKSRATSERAALTAGNGLTNLQPDTDWVATARSVPGLREQKEQKRAEAEVRKAQAKARREHEQRVRELEMHIASSGRPAKGTRRGIGRPERLRAGRPRRGDQSRAVRCLGRVGASDQGVGEGDRGTRSCLTRPVRPAKRFAGRGCRCDSS